MTSSNRSRHGPVRRPERLLRLYPRAWRERYGDEFLATVGDEPLRIAQVINIVLGALDAWLSPEVRRTTGARVATSGEGSMTLKSLMVCEAKYGTRDSLIGAAVMIAATVLFLLMGIAARRSGFLATGEVLSNFSYLLALTASMPFWLMKGQPWRVQAAVIGIILTLQATIGYLTAAI